jgi:hypothetical protein
MNMGGSHQVSAVSRQVRRFWRELPLGTYLRFIRSPDTFIQAQKSPGELPELVLPDS